MDPKLLPLVASALIALAVVAVLFLLAERRKRGKDLDGLREKVARYSSGDGDGASDRQTVKTGKLAAMAGALGKRTAEKESELGDLRLRLVRAGYGKPHAPFIFYGVKCLLGLGLGLSAGALFFIAGKALPPTLRFCYPVILAGVGFYLPDIVLRMMINTRKMRILKELPDSLDLLVVCVEAGMGLNQAFTRVAEETRKSTPEICGELRLLNLELLAGKSRADALRNFARRVDLEEVDALVTLLVQAEAFGTSVAQTLRVYSDTMRVKRYQRAQEMAAKLPVKILLPLLFFIFPALFVVIMGPAAVRVIDMFSKMN